MPLNRQFPPYAQAVRGALTRLCDGESLTEAPRLKSFLCFIVERTLAGQAKSLKAYTIATCALDRKASFDASADAIVRVEAGRLREALARYYEHEGATDPVIITVPRGSYVPTFEWRDTSESKASYVNTALREESMRTVLLLMEARRLADTMLVRHQSLRSCIRSSQAMITETRAILSGTQVSNSKPGVSHEGSSCSTRPLRSSLQIAVPRLPEAKPTTTPSPRPGRKARNRYAVAPELLI